MPGEWNVEILWPEWALGSVDVRENFRNVVEGRLRRGLQTIASRAAQTNPFKDIAAMYEVHQRTSGNLIEFWIENNSPKADFVEEGTPPHIIPAGPPRWLPIVAFIPWANKTGLSPYAAQHAVAAVGTAPYQHPGTKGRHILEIAWETGIDPVIENVQEGIEALFARMGALADGGD